MKFYKPAFSELSLSPDELKILRNFVDDEYKDYDCIYKPLIDLDLLELHRIPMDGHKYLIREKVSISIKGRLYLTYLRRERKKAVIAVLTLVGTLASVLISLLALMK